MIVVNSSTRQFNIPGADLVFGVEADSGSERKYFQCPRYVGNNLDIAGSFVRMNYRNANGEIDEYLVEDVAVDGDNVTFSWKLTPKVTMYKGNVTFVMCVVGPDTKVKWHTTLGRGQVLEGLEPDSAIVEEGTADVVAALIAMVEAQTVAVENVGETWVANVKSDGATQVKAVQTAAKNAETASVAEIEAKGVNVRESIPDDYTALSEAVDALNHTRGAAIVCEAAGETVVVGDSSDLPMQGLRVFGKTTQVTTTGKNLLNTNNMATFLNNQSKEKTGVVVPIETDGVYTYYIADSITVYVGYADSLDVAATHYTSALKDKPATGTISLKAGQYFLLWFDTGITVRDSAGYSLAFGTEVTHEPYSGGKPSPSPDYPQKLVSLKPTVNVYSKNLLKVEGNNTTWNGITYTVNDNGTVVVGGTATNLSYMNFTINVPAGAYRFDGCPPGGDSNDGYFVRIISANPATLVETVEGDEVGSGVEFTLTRPSKIIVRIVVRSGATVSNLVFKPMLQFSVNATGGFKPYSCQTLELTHTLPGIPVTSDGNYTDSDGQQWICDEVDLERGVYVQRIHRMTLDGSSDESIVRQTISDSSKIRLLISNSSIATKNNTELGCAMCDCAPRAFAGESGTYGGYQGISVDKAGNVHLFLDAICKMTESEVRAWLSANPVYIMYALSTPIETALSETEIAAYRALHTNYPNTTVLNDAGAHMVVKYAADTKLYIDNKIAALVGG